MVVSFDQLLQVTFFLVGIRWLHRLALFLQASFPRRLGGLRRVYPSVLLVAAVFLLGVREVPVLVIV
jgi:hypothetical protein